MMKTNTCLPNKKWFPILTFALTSLAFLKPASVTGYTLNTELLGETEKITGPAALDDLGTRVAIEGNTMASVADNSDRVYLYSKTNDAWVLDQVLGTFSTVTAVKIGDGFIVVGDSWNSNRKGAVFIYTESESGWILQQTLYGKADYNLFGQSLDVDGTRIAIGVAEEKAAGNAAAGAAYIYNFTTNGAEQITRLVASDIAARPDDTHGFGRTIAISGNTIAVGAQYYDNGDGVVYVYAEENGQWLIQKVLIDDHGPSDYSLFGTALELDGNTLVIGERNAPGFPAQTGSAFIFERTGNLWMQAHHILPPVSLRNTYFGSAIAYEDDLLLIGSYGQTDIEPGSPWMPEMGYTNLQAGAVYSYIREFNDWNLLKKLVPEDSDPWDDFGRSVALDGNVGAIGAPMSYDYYNPPEMLPAGSVYIFAPDYSNSTNVAAYVRRYLYPEDARIITAFDPLQAAFRYKEHMYTNSTEGLRLEPASINEFYGAAEKERSALAENELLKGLAYHPDSPALGHVLMDIYYDRALPQQFTAADALRNSKYVRLSPPTVAGGLVIDDEISGLQAARDEYLPLIEDYFSLLTNSFGISTNPPLGYSTFLSLAPTRDLEPIQYLNGDQLQPVNGSTNTLYEGYKDLVFLYEALRDYGRTVEPIAQLVSTYDEAEAKNLVADAQHFLYLHSGILEGMFKEQDLNDPAQDARASLSSCLADLESLKQSLVSGSDLLGFADDFLMLVQKFAGDSEDIFDSCDAFESRLNPSDPSSSLSYALTRQDEAVVSYDVYRGYQDQLETQLGLITGTAEDRLLQICGAYPDEPDYETPENNDGCEIWLQISSIEIAQLQIKRNRAEINNLEEEVRIEVERSQAVQDTVVYYADKQAKLTEWIGHINAAQAFADNVGKNPWEVVNAMGQAAGEEAKGQLQAEKERLAAEENAKLEGIDSAAKVETLMLGMKTLAIDSQEAAITLQQEFGRLTALIREKEDLERTLAESNSSLADRYFADPTHHLRYQHQTMLANLSFDEAQKWLYFMARALEYKWNTPFMNFSYLNRKWSTDTLFKLRNADELQEFYNAMVSFNSLVQLPSDDYFDWFSVKEDFLGYYEFDDTGTNQLFYVNPANPNSPMLLSATDAFRSYLRTKMDAIGNINLDFSTRREIAGGTFYRGARFDENGNALSAGLFLDKIKWMKISLPGSHSLGRAQLTGELAYGGTSFVRNFDVGTFHPDRPDRLQNEETAYSTRYWYFHAPSDSWRFSESLSSPVTMQISTDPRVPPTVREIDIFKERSVATTGWRLTIPTEDFGVQLLNIDELDDIELYFYHYAVSRQMPASSHAAMAVEKGGGAETYPSSRNGVPFPYYLRHGPNE